MRSIVPFVNSNFDLTGDSIKIASNSVKKQKATTTTVKPKQKITTTKVNKNTQKLKKRKQTNETEKYVSGLATQRRSIEE
ncbi:hypothetical protein L3X07_06505 [Levilactobacillus brevis]|nr:hypothetical protein [Levilactobacillus brevis]